MNPAVKENLVPEIRERVDRAMRVVRAIAEKAFAEGNWIRVDYGYECGMCDPHNTWEALEPDLNECDDEWLVFYRDEKTARETQPLGYGHIYLVYENGHEVIADYSLDVEEFADAGLLEANKIELEDEQRT